MTFFDIFSKEKVKEEKKIKIVVDNREKNSLVISELMNMGFELEFTQLAVGDYIVNGVAIERKTISDLKSSIINKRIMQQLIELKQNEDYVLLLEGIMDEGIYGPPLHENAFRGFLLAIALEYKVPMIFTQDAKDTAKYISVLAKKKVKEGDRSIRASRIFKTEEEQIQFILEGFPHVGPVSAKDLIKKFGSIKGIVNASAEELEEVLGKRAEEFKKLIDKTIMPQ